jgi:excisionase family DNA binding protein
MSNELPDRLYAPVELAHIVGLKQGTIQNQCRTGQIEARKVGRSWRITREEVKRYLDHGPRKVEDEQVDRHE